MKGRTRTLLTVAATAAALAATAASSAAAAVATAVSSNWAGYAVSGASFRSVSATWTQPAVTCTDGGATHAAFWVGLGGLADDSEALEQIGTVASCGAGGTATYSAWYELVSAAAVELPGKVAPGDRFSASVAVAGTTVTLSLSDETRGSTVVKRLRTSEPDTSSAEWIAEVPSACGSSGTRCRTLTLADFGSVTFANARATTVAGTTGSITSSSWTATRIALETYADFGPRVAAAIAGGADAGSLLGGGRTFTVTYSASAAEGGGPPPGFGL